MLKFIVADRLVCFLIFASIQNVAAKNQNIFSKRNDSNNATLSNPKPLRAVPIEESNPIRATPVIENPTSVNPTPYRRETVANPPYKHAMIMTGGDLDIFEFMGMYDAAVESGNPPDVIIGACGGALAAAIIKAMPNKEERMNFINSRTFYEYMRDIRYSNKPLTAVLKEIKNLTKGVVYQTENPAGEHGNKTEGQRVIPNIQPKFSLMHPDNNYAYEEIDFKFDEKDQAGPELIILAYEMQYDAHQSGEPVKKGQKLYKEAIYSSPEMAAHLKAMGYQSKVAREAPNSFIANDVKLITDADYNTAVRNSYTDPFYLPIDDRYLTGAIGSESALEMSKLAKQLTARYRTNWGKIDGSIMQMYYGLDPWESAERFASAPADRWVDGTERTYTSIARKIAFIPNLQTIPSLGIRVKTNVPKFNHSKFQEQISEQWNFGYARYREANAREIGDKSHVRDRYDTGLPEAQLKQIHIDLMRDVKPGSKLPEVQKQIKAHQEALKRDRENNINQQNFDYE